MSFAKVFVSLFYIHFQCGQDGLYFFELCKYKDPVCSGFTAKQCLYLEIVFAFTYSVSAFITVGNHDLQFFLDVLYMSTASQFFVN